MTQAPPKVIDLYRRAQVDSDMDCGTYVGGTDCYGVDRILEAVAELAGWSLPLRMRLAEREQYLRDEGRADEIDCLGVNGGD